MVDNKVVNNISANGARRLSRLFVYPASMSGTVESGEIKVRRVLSDGTLGPASVIANTDISRSSGFLRMALLGDEVLFSWTEFGEPSHVRTATADVSLYK